jgi:hypothetical protein
MKLRHRPALNAMKYASGNAMMKHRTVAVAAYPSDRRNCSSYCESASA